MFQRDDECYYKYLLSSIISIFFIRKIGKITYGIKYPK